MVDTLFVSAEIYELYRQLIRQLIREDTVTREDSIPVGRTVCTPMPMLWSAVFEAVVIISNAYLSSPRENRWIDRTAYSDG